MFVPFLDLRREIDCCRAEIDQVIARVLDSGRFILGSELEALESEFADYINLPFAIGVASGTDAISLSLEGTGLIRPGAGDEVITSALSAAFSALAICRAGAIPRFVDVDPVTLQIDPARIESCIGRATRAILPVHLYGNSCDLRSVTDLARARHLEVIEDACQAHGSRWKGEALGSFGRAAAFSFYPTKNLGALGDAGMVVTRDEELASRVRKLRHGGQSGTYEHELAGCNSRLDELQAALLRLKLKRLESRNEVRRRMAARYDAAFADLELAVLPIAPDFVPNRHLYPVRTPRIGKLRDFLRNNGIETLVHYPIPLPLQPALKPFVLHGEKFPEAERAAQEIFSLPLYPEMREQELEHVMDAVRRFFGA
jgi:dTDP-4-amino-4,6-dideoxygalactose transaminase